MATARGGTRGLARQGDAITIQVTIEKAKKQRFESLLVEMRASRRDEAGGYDAYWEAVGEVLDKELYVAGGHSTAEAFVREVVKMPIRSAMRNVRVARYASPAEEVKYGTALLDAALGYIEAMTHGPIEGRLPIAFDELRIPIQNKDATAKVQLIDATVEQVRSATRALLGATKKAPARKSAEEQAIVGALRKGKGLGGVAVSVRNGQVRLGAFPVNAFAELVRALAGVKLPAAPKAAVKNAPAKQGKAAGSRAGGPKKKTPAGA